DLLTKTPYNALAVQVHNYQGHAPSPELMIGSSVRLFRKDKSFEYRGRIHEDITPSIVERGERIDTSEIILHHYGYLKATAQNESRFDRNVRLLRQQLDDNPDDGNAWFYLGTEYFVAERHAEAFACYQKAVAIMDGKSGLRPRLVRNMVESLRKTGWLAEAQQLVLTALSSPELKWLSRIFGADRKCERCFPTRFPSLSMLPGRCGMRMRRLPLIHPSSSSRLSTSHRQESSSQQLDSGPSVHLPFQ